MSGFIETGRRTFAKSPVPPADAAPKAVTFAELFAEAQSETSRHAEAAARLRAMADDPNEAYRTDDILECAQTRVRLGEVYGAMMKLIERCRDDAAIRARLGVLAREAAERDAIDGSFNPASDNDE